MKLPCIKFRARWQNTFLAFLVLTCLYIIWQAEMLDSVFNTPDGTKIDFSSRHQAKLIELWKQKQEEEAKADNNLDYISNQLAKKSTRNHESSEEYKKTVHEQDNWLREHQDYVINTHELQAELDDTVKPVCIVYDVQVNSSDKFECLDLNVSPPTPVCLYDSNKDVFISKNIRETGMWEAHIMKTYQGLLNKYKDIGVIDLGANVGMYSLVAAKMGHKVLAVEPNIYSIRRFHKAIDLGHLKNYVTILHNAVSDRRGTSVLVANKDNQGDVRVGDTSNETESDVSHKRSDGGGLYSLLRLIQNTMTNDDTLSSHQQLQVNTITMDDLVDYVTFKEAVLKVDIEGHEHKAFLHISYLFSKVRIRFILMEWLFMRSFYITDVHRSLDKTLVLKMMEDLIKRGYKVFSLVSGKKLDINNWFGWAEDVIWVLNVDNAS